MTSIHRTAAVALGVVLGLVACGSETADQTAQSATTAPITVGTTVAPTTTAGSTTTVGVTTTIGSTAAPTLTVTHVVDGDTVEVSNGEKVRLIGIDSPELGQCGYQEAGAFVSQLVGGKPITLVAVPGRDDRDIYGRLLRYVQVGTTDVGLSEITAGLAIARYDSRDGYGTHPMEAAYIAADAANASPICAIQPATTPAPPPPAAGGLDPQFGTCKEAKANGYGPYTQGVDPEYDWYRDADSDGVVCE